ncbi:type II toxin-antitoxin system RelE/ParE family toxin [Desulfocurvus vexinensis]|uniref:type II toxin-antitoxin system RelE/ParE family toxin n=1 Tax=Desulfocurvus vexinensis TaxID=399548 RepID=UPI000A024FCB
MSSLTLAEGKKHKLIYWVPGTVPPRDHFCECPAITPADKKKIAKSLKRYSENGFPNNREKFKSLGEGLSEIKVTSQLRLIGFLDGTTFVIFLCVRKKQNDLRPEDIEKAKRIRGQYHDGRH